MEKLNSSHQCYIPMHLTLGWMISLYVIVNGNQLMKKLREKCRFVKGFIDPEELDTAQTHLVIIDDLCIRTINVSNSFSYVDRIIIIPVFSM